MDGIGEVSQFDSSMVEKQPGTLTDIDEVGCTHESSTALNCFSMQESGQNGENYFLLMYISDVRWKVSYFQFHLHCNLSIEYWFLPHKKRKENSNLFSGVDVLIKQYL